MVAFRRLCGVLLLFLFMPCVSHAAEPAKGTRPVRVLLLGDSTCIGSICRIVEPKADHLEQVIEKLLAAEKDLPPVQVILLMLPAQRASPPFGERISRMRSAVTNASASGTAPPRFPCVAPVVTLKSVDCV